MKEWSDILNAGLIINFLESRVGGVKSPEVILDKVSIDFSVINKILLAKGCIECGILTAFKI